MTLLSLLAKIAAVHLQAGLAASQAAFSSYHELQNVTQLYAINMQYSGGQVCCWSLIVVCDLLKRNQTF